MVGFRVKRSTTANVQDAITPTSWPNAGNWQNTGSAATGACVRIHGSRLDPGQTYYYWLYELTSTGGVDLLNDGIPASATAVAPNADEYTNADLHTHADPADATAHSYAHEHPVSTNTHGKHEHADRHEYADKPQTPAATATFAVSPQPTDTPSGAAPTQQPTNTSVPVPQGQSTNTPVPVAQVQLTNTPVVSVSTPTVEGLTPNLGLTTPEVKAGATVGVVLENSAAPADQTLQVPPTPTQVLDAAAASGTTSDVTPLPETTNSTPQAVAEEAASGSAPSTERLARPTATPRPSATAEFEQRLR